MPATAPEPTDLLGAINAGLTSDFALALLLGATLLLLLINLAQGAVRREPLNFWLLLYLGSQSATIFCAWHLGRQGLSVLDQPLLKLLIVLAMAGQAALVLGFASLPRRLRLWRLGFIALNSFLLLAALMAPLPVSGGTSLLRLLLLGNSVLCLGHLFVLARLQVDNVSLLLIGKLFLLGTFVTAWSIADDNQQFQPQLFALLQLAIIIEGLLITYVLVMHSIEHWQQRLRHHHQRSLELKLKQQYNSTLKRMDHELRTPLSGVVGIAELLLETTLSRTQRDQVITMRRAGESLLKWLNRLNDWRALQVGRLHFDSVAVDLPQLLQELVENGRVKAEDRKVQLDYHAHPGLPALIKGDPTRLKQIVYGMLDMALFYSEQGHILLSVQPTGRRNRWRLEITDDHSGLHAEDIGIALTDQWDLDVEHYSSVQRNWLIAKALVEHLEGSLEVTLQEEQARFSCELTLQRYSLLQHHEQDGDQLLRGKRLLVIDDSTSSRKVIAKRAESWGMQVTCVTNGGDGLALIQTPGQMGGNFDAVILDYELPDMSGIELARQLTERLASAGETQPVIIMLSGTSFPARDQSLAVGIRQVLSKPIQARSLKITLAEELTLRQARPHSAPDSESGPD